MKIITNKEADLKKLNTDQLNAIVIEGLAMVDAGENLAGAPLKVIWDEQRWKEPKYECATFQEYCEKHFKKSSRHAYALLENYKTMVALPVPVRRLLKNPAAVTAASKIPAPKRAETIKKAAAESPSGKATAKAITKNAPPPRKKPTVEKSIGPLDVTGMPIPRETIDLWLEADEYASSVFDHLNLVIRSLQNHHENKDWSSNGNVKNTQRIFAEIGKGMGNLIAKLKGARGELELIIPHAVCTSCQGKMIEDCETCSGRGYISKFYYDNFVPEELRKIREAK